MSSPKRNRARVLTPTGLKKLQEQIRSHEREENSGIKYTLERLGELTGLDSETVKNVLDCRGSDKRSIHRCFETFGLTLEDIDHTSAAQVQVVSSDPNFVGREGAIADLDALASRDAKVIVIQARGGVGKTTLARKYLQQRFGSFLEFPIAKETKDIASIEGLIEEKLRQLGEEPGREFLVSLDRLKRKLQAECIGILIDNLEPALDSAGKFIEAHRRYVELLRILGDPTVKGITLITSRERLREADVTVQHYPLRSLDVRAWEQFFQKRYMNIDSLALAALHNAYGGNAKAMEIISGAVLEDFSGDTKAYWQANQDDLFIERDLEDLVTKQFDRLQQLDPEAYHLLCRMGCYRYQDVPTIPVEGLFCLLWDVSEKRHRRVVKSLQDRSLVDSNDREFWLHPVIRAEALNRLQVSSVWVKANLAAANYWNESVTTIETIEDALRAFEAYYHFVEINAYEEAGIVIIKERRNNKFNRTHSLGGVLIRFGMWKLMVSAINKIEENIQPGYCLGNLYRILTGAYLFIGSIHLAIEFSQESGNIARSYIKSIQETKAEEDIFPKFEVLLWISLSNIGLCKIFLREFEEAEFIYREMISQEWKHVSKKRTIYEWSILSFLCSCRGALQDAKFFAEKSYSTLSRASLSEFDIWTLGYGSWFLGMTYQNLKNFERAEELYKKAIIHAEETTYFSQVRANSVIGLASLYREQSRYEISLSYLSSAIEILNEIGARLVLAEAYYQLGLTFQAIGETENSYKNFERSIQLFDEAKAPRQVEKVKKSMQHLSTCNTSPNFDS